MHMDITTDLTNTLLLFLALQWFKIKMIYTTQPKTFKPGAKYIVHGESRPEVLIFSMELDVCRVAGIDFLFLGCEHPSPLKNKTLSRGDPHANGAWLSKLTE